MRDIKKRIKLAMLKKDIKVGALAEMTDIEVAQLSVWLSRPDSISLVKLSELADALGCDIALVDRNTGEVYK